MTAAMGMLCGAYQPSNQTARARGAILLCADTMATYVAGSKIAGSSQAESKIYPLAHGFYGAFSDDYYWSYEVLTELYDRLLKLNHTSLRFLDDGKREVASSFEYAYLWYRREVLKDEVGLTEDEYLHDKDLAPDLREHAQAIWPTLRDFVGG